MSALRVTTQDVEDAIRRGNTEIPAGRIEGAQREFGVVANTDVSRPGEFENLIIRNQGGYSVRLGEVASVKLGPQNERTFVRFNGESAVALGVIKQATGNPVELADRKSVV